MKALNDHHDKANNTRSNSLAQGESTSEKRPIVGVIIGRTVRSAFCTLVLLSDAWTKHKLLKIEFDADIKSLRSYCRREYKLGTEVHVFGSTVSAEDHCIGNLISVGSIVEVDQKIRLNNRQCWTIQRCQEEQQRIYKPKPRLKTDSTSVDSRLNSPTVGLRKQLRSDSQLDYTNPHGNNSGIMKKIQAQAMAEFLIRVVSQRLGTEPPWMETSHQDQSTIPTPQVRELLNSNGGVWDVAGGSGHVAAELSLRGIRCTVVDPREKAGMLPRRDRKAYWKGIQTCLPADTPPIPYQTMRAWLGKPPEGVDQTFRNVDQAELPVLTEARCSAIVAFHPDEATDAIVDLAVRCRIPFCIVPCCVFGRLFPNRLTPGGGSVNTLPDLLDYLQAKHPCTRRARLSFQGANTVLWSTFD